MNPFPFPYIPTIPPKENNIYKELEKIKQEINELEKRIKKLEQNKENEYLQKEDGMYMI